MTSQKTTDRIDAHEEDECLLCSPAPHRNCEVYTVVQMVDPSKVPLGDSHGEHLVDVPVCLEHYQTFEQYQRGRNVEEIRV